MQTTTRTEGNITTTHATVDSYRRRVDVHHLDGRTVVTVRDTAPTIEHDDERIYRDGTAAEQYAADLLTESRIRSDFSRHAQHNRSARRQF